LIDSNPELLLSVEAILTLSWRSLLLDIRIRHIMLMRLKGKIISNIFLLSSSQNELEGIK